MDLIFNDCVRYAAQVDQDDHYVMIAQLMLKLKEPNLAAMPKDNLGQINFAVRHLEENNLWPVVQQASKSKSHSKTLYRKGTKHLKNREYDVALMMATVSIATAKKDSIAWKNAFECRSAILFKLEKYEECLANIEQAMSESGPKGLMKTLMKRKKDALRLLPKQTKIPYYAELRTFPENDRNPNIPSASNAIAIAENLHFGRHIIAQRDIKIGEILIVEKPIGQVILKYGDTHCSECLCLCYILIPCNDCTIEMYCSKACMKLAYDRYHKYECLIGGSLDSFFNKPLLLATRIAFATRHEWNAVDLQSYTRKLPMTEGYHSDRYKEVHHMKTVKSQLSDQVLDSLAFYQAKLIADVCYLLKHGTKFFDKYDQEKFKSVLMHLTYIVLYNMKNVEEYGYQHTAKRYIPDTFARGIHPLCGLLNHSCSANVAQYFCGSKMIIYSLRNIKKGEQCFINYGVSFTHVTKSVRLSQLYQIFGFKCTCKACKGNWPLMGALKPLDRPFCIDDKTKTEMKALDYKLIKKMIPKLMKYIEEVEDSEPSSNLLDATGSLIFCFYTLGNTKRPVLKKT